MRLAGSLSGVPTPVRLSAALHAIPFPSVLVDADVVVDVPVLARCRQRAWCWWVFLAGLPAVLLRAAVRALSAVPPASGARVRVIERVAPGADIEVGEFGLGRPGCFPPGGGFCFAAFAAPPGGLSAQTWLQQGVLVVVRMPLRARGFGRVQVSAVSWLAAVVGPAHGFEVARVDAMRDFALVVHNVAGWDRSERSLVHEAVRVALTELPVAVRVDVARPIPAPSGCVDGHPGEQFRYRRHSAHCNVTTERMAHP